MTDERSICDSCGKRRSMHTTYALEGRLDRCCRCFVRAGEIPADWHSECMSTYAELHPLAHPGDLTP